MNKNTNQWAVMVGNINVSEAVQRIAFSFGYEWLGSGKAIYDTAGNQILYFNPDNKRITCGLDCRKLSNLDACKVCYTLEEAMETFKNPPQGVKMVEIGNVKIYNDGSLLVSDDYPLDSKVVDKIFETRIKLMGKEKSNSRRLPILQFVYDSPTSGRLVREVLLLKDNIDTYEGLDVRDGKAFKHFRKDRISGTVTFVGLSEAKEW